ncbi:MAG: peptide-methionine (S)-S-oxide reductase, partial [Phycisphaerales bacterium]
TVAYSTLVELFFKYHDPTTVNRQGPDVGTQYRSAIFTTDAAQEAAVKKVIETISATDRFKTRKIVTEVASVTRAGAFYSAEDYHQDYHEKNGGHCALPEH